MNIPIRCAFDEMIGIDKLKPHPQNRNKHPVDQIDRLSQIIKYQGIRSPIKVSKRSGFITAGHGRLEAFRRLKMHTVPVDYQDYETDEQEYADIQSDNAIALWAELDLSGINADVPNLGPEFDLDLLGIKDFQLKIDKSDPLTDEDEVPDQVEPKTKPGDIYKLGDHRLMCGDSTNATNISDLLNNSRVDITFTSPPYNLGKFKVTGTATNKINEPRRSQKYLTVKDDMTPEDYEQFIFDVISICIGFSDSVLVNIGLMEANKRPVMKVVTRLIDCFKETLYWKKSTSTPHIQAGIVTSLVEPIFCFGAHNSRMFKNATFKGNCPNVIEGSNAGGNEYAAIHAATFPVYLPEWVITNFSQGAVFDPFGGSGSTLIACENTNRKCFMMELYPHYCDVIVTRWERYTGKLAELING